jgi:hypothetical protein
MLNEQQDVVDPPGPPLLDDLPLKRERICVGNDPQTTDF